MEDVPTRAAATAAGPAERELSFVFTGRGGEYFKIWIVNVCLTVLTLGIYSAWAKVRTRRYFYRNVILDGHGFDYHARPITILKGRLIAALVLGGTYAAFWYRPLVGAALFGVLFLLSPWIVNQASRFNARMTSYRNVRFGFAGSYGRAFVAMCVWPVVGIVSFGLLMPLAMQRRNAYLMKNYVFGNVPFSGTPSIGAFYLASLQGVGLVLLVFGVLMIAAFALAFPGLMADPQTQPALPIFVSWVNIIVLAFFVAPFVRAKMRNAVFCGLALGDHRFLSRLSGWRYSGIVLTNFFLTIMTLGLLFPWTQVRLARYVAAQTMMIAASDLSEFSSVGATQGSAAASELAVLEGLAIGIGV